MASTFDEIAAELYALRPEEFVAARDERVRSARAEGDKAMATEIGGLRRPTQSAWLVNALWRDQQSAVDELLGLGDRFRDAMARGAGGELQELTRSRRSIEAALLKRVRALGSEAGIAVSADMLREIEQTLAAGLADAAVADEVRSGRLARTVEASGFGAGPPALTVASGGRADTGGRGRSGVRKRGRDTAGGENAERDGAEADRETKRVAQAELEAATATLAERRREAKRAGQDLADTLAEAHRLRERQAELQAELTEVELRLGEAEERVGAAEVADARARKQHEDAEAAYARAHEAAQAWR